MTDKPIPETLTVNFHEAKAGFIYYNITTGKQTFNNHFSFCFDPLPRLKCWLEAISIGVQQTSFQYDNEGTYIKFDFKNIFWPEEILTISDADEHNHFFIKTKIERRQLVKAFYYGLLTFARSDKYDPKHWELVYLKDELSKALNLEEVHLIPYLAALKKIELEDIIFSDKKLLTASFLPALSDDKGGWFIPEEYNFWSTAKKTEFVIWCINEKINYYDFDGMKIKDFRSSIIENYLEE